MTKRNSNHSRTRHGHFLIEGKLDADLKIYEAMITLFRLKQIRDSAFASAGEEHDGVVNGRVDLDEPLRLMADLILQLGNLTSSLRRVMLTAFPGDP